MTKPKTKIEELCCVDSPVQCTRPAQTGKRCQPHYRYFNRHGVDNPDPLREDRGDLKSLSFRVTKVAMKELERAGSVYRVGSEVIENWAQAQIFKRKSLAKG